MLKIGDRVKFVGNTVPELCLSSGMEGEITGVNAPNDVYEDSEMGELRRERDVVYIVNFWLELDAISQRVSLHSLQNALLLIDPAFGDVPESVGIGVFASQIKEIA